MEHDELLDRALASYSAAEPAAGMGERVLRRTARKRRTGIWFAVPVVASATVCALWMLAPVTPSPQFMARLPVALESVQRLGEIPQPRRKRVPRPAVARGGFTEQERALVHWAAFSSETPAVEWTAMEERTEVPLEIKSLEIQPILLEEQEQ